MEVRGNARALCCFDPKRTRFAAISKDNRIKIFEISTNKLLTEFIEPKHLTLAYTTISWTHDNHIAVGTNNGFISVWDVSRGVLLDAWKDKTASIHQGGVGDVVCGSGTSLFSCGADRALFEINIKTGQIIHAFKKDSGPLSKLALTKDQSVLAVGGTTIKLWDLSSKKLLKKFPGHTSQIVSLQFEFGGNFLLSAAANDRLISMWDCSPDSSSSAPLRVFTCETSSPLFVSYNVYLDLNVNHIVAVTDSGSISIWKYQSQKESKKPITPSLTVTGSYIFADFSSSNTVGTVSGNLVKPNIQLHSYINSDNGEFVNFQGVQNDQSNNVLGGVLTSDPIAQKQKASQASTLGPADMKLPLDVKHAKTEKQKKQKKNEDAMEIENLENNNNENNNEEEAPKSKDKRVIIPPKVDSLQSVLMQALHTHDIPLLESCLAVSDPAIINNTVQRLPTTYVLPFLKQVIDKFSQKPSRGITLVTWIRAVLVQHTSYLMTVPDLVKTLSILYLTVDARLNVFKKLLKLSGRLDLLLSQVSAQRGRTAQGPIVTYEQTNESDEDDDEEFTNPVGHDDDDDEDDFEENEDDFDLEEEEEDDDEDDQDMDED